MSDEQASAVLRHAADHFRPLFDRMDPKLDPRPVWEALVTERDRLRLSLDELLDEVVKIATGDAVDFDAEEQLLALVREIRARIGV